MKQNNKPIYFTGSNKKYKIYHADTPDKLKKAFKERAEDMAHTLTQLYAQQEELIITYTMKNNITYTTERPKGIF